jgi:hypothetical protein
LLHDQQANFVTDELLRHADTTFGSIYPLHLADEELKKQEARWLIKMGGSSELGQETGVVAQNTASGGNTSEMNGDKNPTPSRVSRVGGHTRK